MPPFLHSHRGMVIYVLLLWWTQQQLHCNVDAFQQHRRFSGRMLHKWQRVTSFDIIPWHHYYHTTERSTHNSFTLPLQHRHQQQLRMVQQPQQQQQSYDNIVAAVAGQKLPSSAVLDAVASSPRKDAVVASDVASAAGISLSQARQDLTTLAALVRADLAVTNDGELLYSFPDNFKSVLAQNSAKYQLLQTVEKAWPLVFWVVRVSFGVALLASLVAIFSTIIFIQSSSSSSSDERRRDDRGGGIFGGGFGGYWGPSPFDVFYYRPYGSYGYYGTGANYRDPDDMGFLESIFSYLFGDGNPNAGLEERRLALAASMIRQNKGAVTAEQLAPFCDDAPSPSTVEDSTYADETFVLPIVSALGGEPIVTDDGNIVYVFSELQTTATTTSVVPVPSQSISQEARILKRAGMKASATSREIMQVLNYNGISTRGVADKSDLIRLLEKALPPMSPAEEADAVNADMSILLEQEIKFSVAPDLNKFLAGALGVVNLGGALYLGNLLAQIADYGYRLPSYFGTVQALYPFLLGYAVLFNIIPAVRNIYIKSQNNSIQVRNARRRSWQSAMANAITSNSRISQKLKSAKLLQTKMRTISAADVVYDTKQSIEDMKKEKDELSMSDFDKLLENSETKRKDEASMADFDKLLENSDNNAFQ